MHLEIFRGRGPASMATLPHGGWYDRVRGHILLLHRRGCALWLQAESKRRRLAVDLSECSSDWRDGGRTPVLRHLLGFGQYSTFSLNLKGATVLTLNYRRQSWDVPYDNPPFRDPEVDDDFVLYIHTLVQSQALQEGVASRMSAAD